MRSALVLKKTAVALAVLVLAGCASVNINESVDQTNQELNGFTNGNLSLVQTDEQRQAMAAKASQILKEPLSQPAAVELMLTHSPQFQTVLAENWAQAAQAAQSGRIHNPVFAFERLRIKDELADRLLPGVRIPVHGGHERLDGVRLTCPGHAEKGGSLSKVV